MNYLFSQEAVQPELQNLVNNLKSVCNSRNARIQAQDNFIKCTNSFVQSEVPKFEKSMMFALEPFTEIGILENSLLESETRCCDDFNDVIERAKVIKRLEKEQKEAVSLVEASKKRFNEAKLHFENQKSRNTIGQNLKLAEDNFNNARNAKIEAINKAKLLTLKLIEEKKKFSHFRLNRVRHACKTYSTAVVEIARKESELYKQLVQNISDTRRQIDHISMKEGRELVNII